MDNDYISKMKKMYIVDPDVVDNLNWLLVLAGATGTILCVFALSYWLIRFFAFLLLASRGAKSLKDTKFWKRMAVGLLLILLFMTGSVFTVLSQFYDYMAIWGWGD
ncbi:hypothetical protein H1230_30155 [Paenibacillus sp. 19GGS1-52]|uniref:hypothetical protein n=1 Tax=Paenibacillus sp. 19GGS1-52 TaxID=2758563 RepID=UPI001EFBAF42|nr:hypothetical protein [Paenibacillus sp. 19GGS1-52]ULO07152.1 hypothetical protein H1230_30155 [Paenibacillus sp. 19GGS1-52]